MKLQEGGENFIMRSFKSRRMRWVEHVVCMGKMLKFIQNFDWKT
jgi:hypothetical protein